MRYLPLAPLSISLYASFAIAGCSQLESTNDQQQDLALEQPVFNTSVLSKMAVKKFSQLKMSESLAMPSVAQDTQFYPMDNHRGSERYQAIIDNVLIDPAVRPLSTFSTDVDTASYANVRRFINQGLLPPADAVRTEEIVNYFDYHYSQPTSNQQPVKIAYELAPSPWNNKAQLLKISLQAKDIKNTKGKNLVFLVDVSGSMSSADKLPLLKRSLHLLTKTLNSKDCIAIVAYAGNANVVLQATSGSEKKDIDRVISNLRAGGSTNGGNGLDLAYQIAEANFIKGGVNRILLATDGDFNVGMSDVSQMKSYIEKKRKTAIDLSVLGFGQGNYNDHLMEELSNAGNGNAAYIDSLQEAQKVLVHQANATFKNVAFDAKIQVEFNPAVVASYRLLGYENRALADRDFKDDKKDAGDIGAGQSVTALYEIVYNGQVTPAKLRYKQQQPRLLNEEAELGFIKIRYKLTRDGASKEYSLAVTQDSQRSLANSTASFRLATAAAAYAQKLRNNDNFHSYSWQQIINLAVSAKGEDAYGYRSDFIQQLRLTKALDN
ncbi:MAG: VWA domain-containing protein [Oceanospirillaceae bacterium]|nr:VWA domain-containing protein [Oceanospirillaceae bacterium]